LEAKIKEKALKKAKKNRRRVGVTAEDLMVRILTVILLTS
jgi:hypothetical protein